MSGSEIRKITAVEKIGLILAVVALALWFVPGVQEMFVRWGVHMVIAWLILTLGTAGIESLSGRSGKRVAAVTFVVAIVAGMVLLLVSRLPKPEAPQIVVKVEKQNRARIHVDSYRLELTPNKSANLTLTLVNTGIQDAITQIYYSTDFRRIPTSDVDVIKLEDDLYASLSSAMVSLPSVSNTIPVGATRYPEPIQANLDAKSQAQWLTGKYAVYYIGVINYQDKTPEPHVSRFCLAAKNNGEILSCRRYNEEP